MRVAIVGAGVAGLTSAYLLHTEHEVTVFEADDRLGGHAHTVRVETADETHDLDTGFIVFNDRNYPSFERLMARLGVEHQDSDMSFSVSDGRGDFEYSSASLNGLLAKRSHIVSPAFARMVAEVPRFQRAARELIRSGDEHVSLRAWLRAQGFSSQFADRLLIPQAAAVWSADPSQMWSFPALFLARFFDNHGMLSLRGRPRWRTVSGGSLRYVQALSSGFAGRVHLRSPVQSIRREGEGVLIHVRGAEPLRFDQVVIAAHSDQALMMLSDATPLEREILGAIPYQENEAILHTDQTLLPRRRRAWASWNYHLLDEDRGRTTVTYHLNRLQRLSSARQFCVTLNHGARIAPEHVIRRMSYAHPVYTSAGMAAQRRVGEISGGGNGTHFCGAYWGWGFHEDGVNSAVRVAEGFGARL